MGAPWLPESALTSADNANVIASVVRDWSALWLRNGELTSDLAWNEVDQFALDQLKASDGLVAVEIVGKDNLSLASQILGRNIELRSMRKPADADLLSFITEEAITSLKQQLEQALPKNALAQPFSDQRFALTFCCDRGVPVLSVALSKTLLVEMAKNRCPVARKMERVSSRSAALPSQSVWLGAIIGTATASLEDIRSLSVGDVIVLDEAIEDSVDITIDGARKAPGAAFIESTKTHHSLILERAVHQW